MNDVMTTQTPAALRTRADEMRTSAENAIGLPWRDFAVELAATLAALADAREEVDALRAMSDATWTALDTAGAPDVLDTRTMVQVSKHSYEEDGEYRQLDPVERVEALAAERNALRATVDRLRPVVEALATWLDVEAERDGDEESAYDAWSRAVDTVTLALGLPAKRWGDAVPTLRALLATPDAVADVPEVPDGD